jgi:hypothetical protein
VRRTLGILVKDESDFPGIRFALSGLRLLFNDISEPSTEPIGLA